MRVWMILLLMTSTLAALGVGIWYLDKRNSDDLDPAIEMPSEEEFVDVLYGENDEVEVLFRPELGDSGTSHFHESQLNRMLKAEDRLHFGRLWIINHSKKTMAFDPKEVSELVFKSEDSKRSTSLVALSGPKVTAADRMVLETFGQFNRTTLKPREFVSLIVVLPQKGQELMGSLASLPFANLKLQSARARSQDLIRFVSAPSGRIEELLIKTEEDELKQEQASSK